MGRLDQLDLSLSLSKKEYGPVKVIETVNAELERGMQEVGFPVPTPSA